MDKTVREKLLSYEEKEYKEFTKALNPNNNNILGVRVPILRKIAKEYAKEDWKKLLEEGDVFLEETFIRGMILGYSQINEDEFFKEFSKFVPLIDTWATCDTVISGCKIFQKDKFKTWDYIQKYLHSSKEFYVRTGLCILMMHLLRSDEKGRKISRYKTVEMCSLHDAEERQGLFINNTLDTLNREFNQGYYAHMGAAWLLAEAFCSFPSQTLRFIENNKMDRATLKKGITKIKESKIPTEEVKLYLGKYI